MRHHAGLFRLLSDRHMACYARQQPRCADEFRRNTVSRLNTFAFTLTAALAISMAQPSLAAKSEHQDEGHRDEDIHEEQGGGLELNADAMTLAGIVVEPLQKAVLNIEIEAPGEVKLNSYLSAKVTPRIEAQVLKRHARLGDDVTAGQPLVTLSSVDFARAISELLVADKEWKRVRQLGTSVVSTKRSSEAQIEREQTLAIARAYGVSDDQLNAILAAGVAKNPGAFQLLAPQAGVIVSDRFIIGELVQAGRVLFDIVDETILWVESSLPPDAASEIVVGAEARVRDADNTWHPAKVIQKHHQLDEETRTIGVRLEIRNTNDHLHAGMYVDTRIESLAGQDVLAVPTEAVLKSPDGDWMIFIEEEPGHFVPREVEIIRTSEQLTVIEGVPAGTRVVTRGAFFVQSELAKSGFDVHNH